MSSGPPGRGGPDRATTGREVPVSARAILLTPRAEVLLLRKAGRSGDIWITPGGRVKRGEARIEAVRRELREETGADLSGAPPEVWIRHGTFLLDGRRVPEREHFFLVPTGRFVPTASWMEAEERSLHREFRWWRIADIAGSGCRFVPGEMGSLLADLVRDGAPGRALVIRE